MYNALIDFWVRSIVEATFLPYRMMGGTRLNTSAGDTKD